MIWPFLPLFPHEFQALLDVLRRDLHAERMLAERNTEESHMHGVNVRTTLRLLEALQPKNRSLQEAAVDASVTVRRSYEGIESGNC